MNTCQNCGKPYTPYLPLRLTSGPFYADLMLSVPMNGRGLRLCSGCLMTELNKRFQVVEKKLPETEQPEQRKATPEQIVTWALAEKAAEKDKFAAEPDPRPTPTVPETGIKPTAKRARRGK